MKLMINKLLSFCLVTLLTISLGSEAFASHNDSGGGIGVLQKKTITGKVIDEKGEALPGVSVYIEGTSIGTTTNFDGEFSLNIDYKPGIKIAFQFVGYEKITRDLSPNDKVISISLEPSQQMLDEIVVNTGFQKIDRRSLTGSVTSIKFDSKDQPALVSIDQALEGKVAGMQVLTNTSTPGVAQKIRIRGNSSITGNREPVWVVDGVVLEDPVDLEPSALNSHDFVNRIGNAISSLNPSDIDRIDVLKDVSATAIYGTKAANGVIVITTKRGAKGKTRVNFTSSISVTERPTYRQLNTMNSEQRIALSEEIAERGLAYDASKGAPLVGYERLLEQFNHKKISYDEFNESVHDLRGVNTNWLKELLRVPVSHNQNLSISGGTDIVTYRLSASLSEDKGVQRNTGVKRKTFGISTMFKASKKLSINSSLTMALNNDRRVHEDIDLMGYATMTNRAIRLKNTDGSLYFYPRMETADKVEGEDPKFIGFNMLHELDHSGVKQEGLNVNLNTSINYQYNNNLSFNGLFSHVVSDTDIEKQADERSFIISQLRQTIYGDPIPDNLKSGNPLPFGGMRYHRKVRKATTNVRLSMTYNKQFNNSNFDFQLGTALTDGRTKAQEGTDLGYFPGRGKTFVGQIPEEFTTFISKIKDQKLKLRDNVNRMLSFYGILRYSIKNKYFFNFNMRADGSNQFGQDESTRFLPVWSISGRWNMSREKWFFESFKFIDAFSVKASYGFQGNVNPTVSPNLILARGGLDASSLLFSSTIDRHANPKLKWEKTKSYNFGTSISLFKNFVFADLEYYYKRGEDQIVQKRVSPTNGKNSFAINFGTVTNQGWELNLGFNFIQKRDIAWSMVVRTGKNKNKVTNSGDNDDDITYENYLSGDIIKNGRSLNSFYSYQFAGLDKNGLPTYHGLDLVDEQGNPKYKNMQEALEHALKYSGKREPVLAGGISNNFRYKNFKLSTDFAFAFGHKIRLRQVYYQDTPLPIPSMNASKVLVDRWRKPGDEGTTNVPVITDDFLNMEILDGRIARNKWQMYNNSDLRVVKGDYLKMSRVSFSYSLPQNVCKGINLEACSMGFNVSNVFTIASSKLNGQDPVSGASLRTIPAQRRYSITFNFTL